MSFKMPEGKRCFICEDNAEVLDSPHRVWLASAAEEKDCSFCKEGLAFTAAEVDSIKARIEELEAGQLEALTAALELQQLFDLQQTRMGVADNLWRMATGKHNVSPDLGQLIEWLLSERGNWKAAAEEWKARAERLLTSQPELALWTEIQAELARAKEEDIWHEGKFEMAGILNDRCGRAVRMLLDYLDGDVRKEIIQTAALCLRVLENLPEGKKENNNDGNV